MLRERALGMDGDRGIDFREELAFCIVNFSCIEIENVNDS